MNTGNETKNRTAIITRTSILSIITNIVLASTKYAVGFLIRSVSITNDAINNFSDALSSVITLIGSRLANKKPDEEHPLGHGRAEYMSSIIISIIILYAGLTTLIDSIKHIFHPEAVNYTTASVVLVIIGIAVKFFLGHFVQKQGKKVNSAALEDSGIDALFDAVISTSVLLSIICNKVFGWNLEAWFASIIALWILKTGITMLKDTISTILGKRFDPERAKNIHDICESISPVIGSYDLIIHDYGPEYSIGSIYIAVPEYLNVSDVDSLSREIQQKVYEQESVILTAVGIYSVNDSNPEIVNIRESIEKIINNNDSILQIHGFFCDLEQKQIRFDLIIPFSVKKRNEILLETRKKIQELYPEYSIIIALDSDIS